MENKYENLVAVGLGDLIPEFTEVSTEDAPECLQAIEDVCKYVRDNIPGAADILLEAIRDFRNKNEVADLRKYTNSLCFNASFMVATGLDNLSHEEYDRIYLELVNSFNIRIQKIAA